MDRLSGAMGGMPWRQKARGVPLGAGPRHQWRAIGRTPITASHGLMVGLEGMPWAWAPRPAEPTWSPR